MRHQIKKLGDFCRTGSGGTPSRSELERYYEGGNIPWVKSGELREGLITSTEEHVTEAALRETSIKLVPAGAILLAMYGATVGRLAILGIEATTNQAVCHIVPDPDAADTRYLYHAISAQVPAIIAMGVGGAQPNISQRLIKDLTVSLPSLSEQRRIAAILDQADALRVKRREALAQLDELQKAIFIEMFGDPLTNPKGWQLSKLGMIGKLDRGVSKHRPRNAPELLEGPYPLIQTGDVANSDGYIRTYASTYSEFGLRQSKLWPAGTLCITIAANIAKTGILTFDACFPDSVVGFTSAHPATVEFVRVWLSFLQKMLEESAPESAQKNINLAILRDLDIPVPPLNLQAQFAAAITSQRKLTEVHRVVAAEFESLFASLQHRAFQGAL